MSCVSAYVAKHFRPGIQVGQEIRVSVPRECPQKVCKVLSQFYDAGTMVWDTKKGNSSDGAEKNLVLPVVGNN